MKKNLWAGDKSCREKILELTGIRRMTPAELRAAAGISRATMSRLMNQKEGYLPSEATLKKIASVLEVNPLYLKEDNVIGPGEIFPYLTEDDLKFFMDLRNLPFIKLSREMADKGVSPGEMRKLVEILISTRDDEE